MDYEAVLEELKKYPHALEGLVKALDNAWYELEGLRSLIRSGLPKEYKSTTNWTTQQGLEVLNPT